MRFFIFTTQFGFSVSGIGEITRVLQLGGAKVATYIGNHCGGPTSNGHQLVKNNYDSRQNSLKEIQWKCLNCCFSSHLLIALPI